MVPRPCVTRSVSPLTKRMRSGGMPSLSKAIWRNTVSCPWPWLWLPISRVTLPPESKRISAASSIGPRCGPPALSMALATAMPRSLPRAFASARRASKPRQSPASSAISMFRGKSPLS